MLDLIKVRQAPLFTIADNSSCWKAVFGATWDKANNRWLFPAFLPFHDIVLRDIEKVQADLNMSQAAQKFVKETEVATECLQNGTPPDKLEYVTDPYDHQREGVNWCYWNHRAALFWEPGTGKTKTIVDTLRALRAHGESPKALILCPTVIVENWRDEFIKHGAEDFSIGLVTGTTARKRKAIAAGTDNDVTIATYGMVRTMGSPKTAYIKDMLGDKVVRGNRLLRAVAKVNNRAKVKKWVNDWLAGRDIEEIEEEVAQAVISANWLKDIPFNTLICDESHMIKDVRSQQTKATLKLSAGTARRYILSGTPTLGDPGHLYPQLRLLAPYLMPENWWVFSERYFKRSAYNRHIVTGYKNLHIINKRVDVVANRKTKEECLDLPEQVIQDLNFELGKDQKDAYNDLVRDDETTFEDIDVLMETANAGVRANKLMQIISGFSYYEAADGNRTSHAFKKNPKLELLLETVESIRQEPTAKLLIWAQYTEELETISKALDNMKPKVKHYVVSGSNSSEATSIAKKFNNDPDALVYLAQTSTGIGLNLTSANYVVYYTLPWSLLVYQQSIDRNYRAGQTRKVTVYRLVSSAALDRFIAMNYEMGKETANTMIKKLSCAHCAHAAYCVKNDISLFDRECIYDKKASKLIARASELK